jgi:hypothetical protein
MSSNGKAAALRKTAYREVLAALARLPENEQFYLLNRVMIGMNPEAIPVKIDGRRISTQDSLRRLALRKDRAGSHP